MLPVCHRLRHVRRLIIANDYGFSGLTKVGVVERFGTVKNIKQAPRPQLKNIPLNTRNKGKFQPKEMLFHSSLQVLLSDISYLGADMNEIMFKLRKITDPRLLEQVLGKLPLPQLTPRNLTTLFDQTFKTQAPRAALAFYHSLIQAGLELDAIAYATLFQALSLDKDCGLAGLTLYTGLPKELRVEDSVYTSIIQYILPTIAKFQPEAAEKELMKILADIHDISRGLVRACVFYGLKTIPPPSTTSSTTPSPSSSTSALVEKVYSTFKESQRTEAGAADDWAEVELDTLMLKFCRHTHNLSLAHAIFAPYITQHHHVYPPLYVQMLSVCRLAQDWEGGEEIVRRVCEAGYIEGISDRKGVGRGWGAGDVSPLVEVVRFVGEYREHLQAVENSNVSQKNLANYEEKCLHGIFTYMASLPSLLTHNRPSGSAYNPLSLPLLVSHLPFIHTHSYQHILVEYCKHSKDRGVSSFFEEVFQTLLGGMARTTEGDTGVSLNSVLHQEMLVYYEMIRCIPSMIQATSMLRIQACMLLSVDKLGKERVRVLGSAVRSVVLDLKTRTKEALVKELVAKVLQDGGSEELVDCILMSVNEELGVSIRKEDVKKL